MTKNATKSATAEPSMTHEKRVIVALPREEYQRLAADAAAAVRCPDQQATFLIRQALAGDGRPDEVAAFPQGGSHDKHGE